ncbi:MAG: hypothetical protein ACREOS_03575 [Candidatus Dormibacteraceae bacterium]
MGVAMVYAGAFLVGRHELTELMTGGGRLTKRVVLGGLIGAIAAWFVVMPIR